jgi:primosomal replication protein N
MDTLGRNNIARLRGTLAGPIVFSHQNRQERFYRFPLRTERLSGAEDIINVLARERLMQTDLNSAERIEVTGEIRTFNNTSGEGARLVISLFAQKLSLSNEETDENLVLLTGTICKPPVMRRTTLGREICDLMLAVNRHYGRSDYLPCLVWGIRAHDAAEWRVGTVVSLAGRFQSRDYHKLMPDGTVTIRTAYEISVAEIDLT